MNALVTDIRRVIAQHVEQADAGQVMHIAQSLLGAPGPTPPGTPPASPRFTKIGADGGRTVGDHIAVFDSKTGLLWEAEPVARGKQYTHADALDVCGQVSVLGLKWRAPAVEELLSIVDYTRCEPAVDTDYFKGPYGYTWSSTVAAAPAGYAWLVALYVGNSYRDHIDNRHRARAVCAGQQLGLFGLNR